MADTPIVQAMTQAKQVHEALEHIASILDLPVPEVIDSPDGNGIAVTFGDVATVLVPADVPDVPAHVLNKLIFHNPLKWELRRETCRCVHSKVRENALIVTEVLKEKGVPKKHITVIGTYAMCKVGGAEVKIDLTDDNIHNTISGIFKK